MEQLQRFQEALEQLAAAGHRPAVVHAANSAGALAHPAARLGLVRPGIALYGISPGAGVDGLAREIGLRPAMSLKARVSYVKRVKAGEPVSYGLHHVCEHPSVIATVPIGYYDGYDEDNDGTTTDWHNFLRNNWGPGGTAPRATGATIGIGIFAIPSLLLSQPLSKPPFASRFGLPAPYSRPEVGSPAPTAAWRSPTTCASCVRAS